MCETADGDAIDARSRDGTDIGKRHPAGDLQKRRRETGDGRQVATKSNGLTNVVDRHIIQQDRIRASRESFAKFVQAGDFDLDEQGRMLFSRRLHSALNHISPASCLLSHRCEMIRLDEDRIV